MQNQCLKINDKNATRWVLLIIFITFLFRILVASFTGLGTGESYYFHSTQHLALSYFDQPPLFAWLSGITTQLFGISAFSLRLPDVLLFSATTWIIFKTAYHLYSPRAAVFTALLVNSCGLLIIIGTWFQPDAPLVFFWAATLYLLSKMFIHNSLKKTHWRQWLFLGALLGLGLISKYHSIFLIIGLGLFLLLSSDHRKYLFRPQLLLTLFIAALIFSPVLIWNDQHHWASFAFQSHRATWDGHFKLHPLWFLRSILGQSIWIQPWLWAASLFVTYRLIRYQRHESITLFILCFSLPIIIFFTIVTLWSNLQFHFHWAACGYMTLFLPLGDFIARAFEQQTHTKMLRRGLVFSLSFIYVGFTLASLQLETGVLTANKVNPLIEGYDYKNIKTYLAQHEFLNQPHLFLATTHWWLTGKIDWPLQGKEPIICLNNDCRNFSYFYNAKNMLGKNAIIITKENDSLYNAKPFFDSISALPDINITRANKTVLTLKAYLGTHFHAPTLAYAKNYPVAKDIAGTF